MEAFTGKVWVLGDDIDTDIIIPTEYLALKTIDDFREWGIDVTAVVITRYTGQQPARAFRNKL